MHRIHAALLLLGLLLPGLLAPAGAEAHPHVWVQARSEVVLDEARNLVGMRVSWTFDPDYSAFAVLNLDSKRDGVPDPDKLATLARERVAALAETGYFVQAKLNGRPLAFSPPGDARAEYRDGRLTLSFTLAPLASPGAVRTLVVTTSDPDFYVAFGLAPGPEAVRLAGSPACLLKVTHPAKEARIGEQLIPDSEATARPGAAAATGADYTGRVLVACP
ncbi:DUF1007 family protein [Methylobacterium nodulans]|uniref:ABC transporter substrate-binding protein n=1 Tax=Methylobacterium nodulans (strain LMG 21967 / CNCM I-2342 / ORS 2060) TaxID=460265 RepID=B8II13_METNO|nr:DUF1007 family protein [Methylobacterium nodulans]ACL56051.1 protein of unknown function DUF1007 [Methylobacterium nodulans ORS 2060]